MAIDPHFENAVQLLQDASALSRRWFESAHVAIERKSDGTPVTEADRDVESFLRSGLGRLYPDDGVLGEEFPETVGDSGGRWILDPIDGTKSFVKGVPLYSTLLAYEVEGVVRFGAISAPSAGYLVYAQSGRGCFDENGAQVRVSDHTSLDGAHILSTWLEDWPSASIPALQERGATVRTWGDGFGYTMVAKGYAESLVDFTVQPFDVAPMPVIIEEAGGVFMDFEGESSIYSGNAIAATSKDLADELRSIVSADRPSARRPAG